MGNQSTKDSAKSVLAKEDLETIEMKTGMETDAIQVCSFVVSSRSK